MRLVFKITGLWIEDYDILLPRINLIKDKIYPNLKIDYSYLKRNPNTLWIDQEINDEDKALTLFKLLNNLNFKRDKDNPYMVNINISLFESSTV